jgi:NADH:ubiquinone oxidoreductase subunit E
MMGVRMNPEDVFRLVDKHNGEHGSIISILEDIQAQYNFLPGRALRIVASRTGRSLVDIYALATFYRGFSLKPKGRHMVSVCMGTACHVRRSPDVLAGFCQRLNIRPGETTRDREFSLSTVNCLGACALGPVTVIDGEYYRNVKKSDVPMILEHAHRDENILKMTEDEQVFAVNVSCPYCNRSLMDHEHRLDGYPMVRVTVSVRRKHGWVRLSSLYGDYRIESEYEIPPGAIAHFFCPSCHAELKSGRLCATCDAPMMILFVRGGGTVQFCSRRGCKEHILDLVDEEDMRA